MRDLTRDNFGLMIAYLLPGFVALWGASCHVEAVRPWLQSRPEDAPTVGGFLYATLASTALGMVVSGVRWAIVDRVLSRLGVRQPKWDFNLFAERLTAYETLVALHYRYYQFYANMLVALAYAYFSRLLASGIRGDGEWSIAAGFLLLEGVLFAGSWDTLDKYYARTGALLARSGSETATRTSGMRERGSAQGGRKPRGRSSTAPMLRKGRSRETERDVEVGPEKAELNGPVQQAADLDMTAGVDVRSKVVGIVIRE